MYLTKEEQAMLDGKEGETLQKAIEILVALGDIYGADRLIPVKSTQIAGVSYKTIGDAGLEWISDLHGKVRILAAQSSGHEHAGLGKSDHPKSAHKQQLIIAAYEKLGISAKCTCTPYYLEGFNATCGDHLAWTIPRPFIMPTL